MGINTSSTTKNSRGNLSEHLLMANQDLKICFHAINFLIAITT